jgi:uncharacterized membrane protein YqgA involved in biofilm formation
MGTILNAIAIIGGGVIGWLRPQFISAPRQLWLKQVLGVLLVYLGLNQVWRGWNGSWGQATWQFLLVLVAMILGKLAGKLLCLQRAMNGLGQYAKVQCTEPSPAARHPVSSGLCTCTILFCAQPLAILGGIQEGLLAGCAVLAVKAVMDGMTTAALIRPLGWSSVIAAIPVVLYQGGLTYLVWQVQPWLHDHDLVDSVNLVAGLLVFSVALVVLGLKKIELGDYLPSLVLAPLFTWWWR